MRQFPATQKPLHVLVLTGRFGMGHCAAAEAVRQEILLARPDACVRVVDVMDELFPRAAARIYQAFGLLVRRFAGVYNLINRLTGLRAGVPLKGPAVRRLDSLLSGMDLVVTTLPVCSQYISAYKRQRGSRIPLYTYVTDVTLHDEWIAPETDRYFAACDEARQALLARGVDPARITVCGVPVRQPFRRAGVFSRDGKHVLLMGGGLGLIPGGDGLLRALACRPEFRVTVIAGRNDALLRRLRAEFPQVEAVGYTERVDEYMRQADLVITKSGGVTTFEAIHTLTPLYVLKPFLVQEVGNARYIESNGLGWVSWRSDSEVMVNDVLTLLRSPRLLAQMRRNMRAVRGSWAPSSPIGYLTAEPA